MSGAPSLSVEALREIVTRAFDRYHAREHDDVVIIEHEIQHALAASLDGGTKWQTGRNIRRYDIAPRGAAE